jgi:hypothetical protein
MCSPSFSCQARYQRLAPSHLDDLNTIALLFGRLTLRLKAWSNLWSSLPGENHCTPFYDSLTDHRSNHRNRSSLCLRMWYTGGPGLRRWIRRVLVDPNRWLSARAQKGQYGRGKARPFFLAVSSSGALASRSSYAFSKMRDVAGTAEIGIYLPWK